MHFKICRKASSSDDCERITGNPEVIGLSTGLVPRNALVSRDLANFLVGYAEVNRWGNVERRAHLRCCHKNVILIATNGGKMRTKGE
jgi:hypothetical protein